MTHVQKTFKVTEWDWLRLQLRLYALEHRAEMFSEQYFFDDARKITCRIFAQQVQTMRDENTDRKDQLEYYQDWAKGVKRNVRKICESLPGLAKQFDLEKDLLVQIMYHYGMGGQIVCELIGNSVSWKESEKK